MSATSAQMAGNIKADGLKQSADSKGNSEQDNQELSVIKRIAGLILQSGQDKATQEVAAIEVKKIALSNPKVNLNRPINEGSPLTLMYLAVLGDNIPAGAALASLGVALPMPHPDITLDEEQVSIFNGRLLKIKNLQDTAVPAQVGQTATIPPFAVSTPSPSYARINSAASALIATAVSSVSSAFVASASAAAGSANTNPQPSDSKSSSEVIEKIVSLLNQASTPEENAQAAIKIEALLIGTTFKVDLNQRHPQVGYLLDFAQQKKNLKANIILRIHGAEETPQSLALAARNPAYKAKIVQLLANVQVKRKELEKKHSLKAEIINDLKSLDETEKAQRMALVNKLKDKCRADLELSSKYIEEYMAIYSKYSIDLNIEVVNPEAVVQQNRTILETIFKDSICFAYNTLHAFVERKPKEDGTLSFRLVHYFYNQLSQFQRNKEILEKQINALPSFLKPAVRGVFDKNNTLLSIFFRNAEKVLLTCSAGYSKRYQSLGGGSLYETIWQLQEGQTHKDLIAANQKYREILKAEIKVKREEIDPLFEPLKKVLNNDGFNAYKKYYLGQLEGKINKIMAFQDEGNLDSSDTLIKYSLAERQLHQMFTRFVLLVKRVVQSAVHNFLSGNKNVATAEMFTSLQQSSAEPAAPLVSQAERAEQDRKIIKMREAVRREKAKEAALFEARLTAERKKIAEVDLKLKGEAEKVKAEILGNMQQLTKDEFQLMEEVLKGIDSDNKAAESLIKKIASKLNLNYRPTESSSGGGIITVYKTSLPFHRKKQDEAGTLDPGFLANFRKALNRIGITDADLALVKATRVNAPAPASAKAK